LLEFGGTSLLAFMEALRFTASAFAGHASATATVQANPVKADRKIVGCIAFSSLIQMVTASRTPPSYIYSVV
jgi:hypothetical protein